MGMDNVRSKVHCGAVYRSNHDGVRPRRRKSPCRILMDHRDMSQGRRAGNNFPLIDILISARCCDNSQLVSHAMEVPGQPFYMGPEAAGHWRVAIRNQQDPHARLKAGESERMRSDGRLSVPIWVGRSEPRPPLSMTVGTSNLCISFCHNADS